MLLNQATASEREAPVATATVRTKVCTRCHKRRKVEGFYRDKHTKDGLASWCKACTREYDRAYAARKRAEKAQVKS
jgi:hypothetical protein